MPFAVTLPDGYGRVSALALGALPFFSFIQGVLVTSLRAKAKIPYPNDYATVQQAKESRVAYQFNCSKRAHANFLENMPQTIAMMLFAGIKYPQATTLLGLAWLAARFVYWIGYVYSSKRGGDGRLYGAPFWLLQGGIWFLVLLSSWEML